MQISPDDYIWERDEARIRRCLELAERILEQYPKDLFVTGRKAGAESLLLPFPALERKYMVLIEREPEEPAWWYALYGVRSSQFLPRYGTMEFPMSALPLEESDEYYLEALRRACELAPDSFLLGYLLYNHQYRCGPAESGVREGVELLRLAPGFPPPAVDPVTCFNQEWRFQYRIATYAMNQGDEDLAVELFEDIVSRWQPEEWDPENYYHRNFAKVHNNLAILYDKAGEFEKARGAFLRSLELNPEEVYALFNLAAIQFREERFEDTLEYLDRFVDLVPDRPPAWTMMAWSHLRLGNLGEARRAASRFVELRPGDDEGKSLLEMIERRHSEKKTSSGAPSGRP
jgi:tetratricopeptide (TPR) repeat protein